MKLKGELIVEKRNVLNEIRSNSMGLQEIRFFSIYLSRINARDVHTRLVKFPLSEFVRILEIDKVNIYSVKQNTDNLLTKIVHLDNPDGGFTAFQLFKECRVFKDNQDEWCVEIDAHDKALPLMFEFKKNYFTYKLWNALRLHSANQIRMYEILKQYEKIGERILSVEDLRNFIGIAKNEYPRFGDFRKHVLDACQLALKITTDICYEYEPYGKKGPHGKILTLKFTIRANKDYVDQLSLFEFIDEEAVENIVEDMSCDTTLTGLLEQHDHYKARINSFIEILDNNFIFEQVEEINHILTSCDEIHSEEDERQFLRRCYLKFKTQNSGGKVKHPFPYFRSIVQTGVVENFYS